MGKIPRYQTSKLASEVVGTPGIDTSAVNTINSISTGLGQVTQATFDTLKARQQALDAVEADAKTTDFSLNYLQQLEELKQTPEAISDPLGTVSTARDLGTRLGRDNLNNIKSETVRALVAKAQNAEIRKQGSSSIKWAFDQQNKNALIFLTSKMNNLAEQARAVDDPNQLQDIFGEATRSVATAANVVKEPSKFIQSNMENIAAGFIYGQIERNPVEAGRLLREGLFSNILSQKERESFQNDIEKAITKRADETKFNNLFDTSLSFSKLSQSYAEGTLKLDELDAAITDAKTAGVADEQISALETLREITLSSKNLTVADNAEVYSDVWDKYNNLEITTDEKSATARLQEFYKFQNIVTKSFNDGAISAADFNFFMKKTATAMQNKIAEVTGDKENLFKQGGVFPAIGNFLTPQVRTSLDVGYRKINNYVKTNRKGDIKAKGRLLKQLSNQIFLKEDMQQRELSEVEISDLTDQLILKESKGSNPYLDNVPKEGKIMIHPKTGQKIRVFQDGTINLEA